MIEYPSKLTQIPSNFCSVEDYEAAAKNILSHPVWEYISSGSADESTVRSNRQAFQNLQIWPRVLKDLSQGNTKTQLLGLHQEHPVILGPVAHQKLVDPSGELATAQAAEATTTTMIASTLASSSLEEIAAQGASRLWFQLYWQEDREQSLALVWRAQAAGYKALVITVDAPINGLRRRIQRAGFSIPPEAASTNIGSQNTGFCIRENESEVFQGWMSKAPTWEDIHWLSNQVQLPVIIKGALHPLDAEKALAVGAQGLILSNHGGRSLDSAPSALDVLPSVRQKVGANCPIIVDGGIRQGSDVFKALALGANAVCLGRPQMYGLAVAGALGVAHLIQLLRQELEVTMALAGCATLSDIKVDCLVNPSR